MKMAIEEARTSRAEGNKGYGAVVLFDDEIIARSHDTASTMGDPSRHAEVDAIQAACKYFGDTDLTGAVLVSSVPVVP